MQPGSQQVLKPRDSPEIKPSLSAKRGRDRGSNVHLAAVITLRRKLLDAATSDDNLGKALQTLGARESGTARLRKPSPPIAMPSRNTPASARRLTGPRSRTISAIRSQHSGSAKAERHGWRRQSPPIATLSRKQAAGARREPGRVRPAALIWLFSSSIILAGVLFGARRPRQRGDSSKRSHRGGKGALRWSSSAICRFR